MSDHPIRDAIWNHSTATIAIYAAVVSTLAAIAAVYREVQSRRDRTVQLKVRLSTELIMLDGYGGDAVSLVQVRVEHHGGPAVTFENNCCTILNDANVTGFWLDMRNVMTSVTKWPLEMKPGTNFTMSLKKKDLYDGLRRLKPTPPQAIRADLSDGINRRYQSDWVKVDLAE